MCIVQHESRALFTSGTSHSLQEIAGLWSNVGIAHHVQVTDVDTHFQCGGGSEHVDGVGVWMKFEVTFQLFSFFTLQQSRMLMGIDTRRNVAVVHLLIVVQLGFRLFRIISLTLVVQTWRVFAPMVLSCHIERRLTIAAFDVFHTSAHPDVVCTEGIVASSLLCIVHQAHAFHGFQKRAHEVIEKGDIFFNGPVEASPEIVAVPVGLFPSQHGHVEHLSIAVLKGDAKQLREANAAAEFLVQEMSAVKVPVQGPRGQFLVPVAVKIRMVYCTVLSHSLHHSIDIMAEFVLVVGNLQIVRQQPFLHLFVYKADVLTLEESGRCSCLLQRSTQL